jgi:hypothetical protein
MPKKHSNTERIGGPGASHENRKQPEKTRERGPHPTDTKTPRRSSVSGGGGERDHYHNRDPWDKAGDV